MPEQIGDPNYRRRRGYSPAEVRRALTYIVVAWAFGAPFFSITAGVPFTSLLTKYLKADDLTYGVIMAAGPAAMVFLFLGSYVAERTGRAKRNFLIFVTFHRMAWFAVAAAALWLRDKSSALWVVGTVAFLSQAAANYGGAGWSAWIADIVPRSVAGSYFGFRARIGMLSMVTVSTAAVFFLERAGGTARAYAMVFALAAAIGTTDILLFIPVPEVPRHPEEAPPTLREILGTPWRNPLFRGFVAYTAVAWMAYMMLASFVWRFCFDPVTARGLGLGVLRTHLLLSILPVTLMAWTAPAWGQAIDRFGPKPVLALSSTCAIVLPAVWVVAHPAIVWAVWLAVGGIGLTWPGIEQVNLYMIMKGFPDTRRTAYAAAFNFVLGLASVAGTALAGVCATFWEATFYRLSFVPPWMSHYQMVFLTSILLRLGAYAVFFPRLQLEGRASRTEVAVAIAEEVFEPYRRYRARKKERWRSP